MTPDLPIPRAWRGRERLMSLILRARTATSLDDAHRERLGALVVSCFGTKTFPGDQALRDAVEEMCGAIKHQAFADGPVAEDPDERLRGIVSLLHAAVAERESLP
jgi:hypothetical protein